MTCQTFERSRQSGELGLLTSLRFEMIYSARYRIVEGTRIIWVKLTAIGNLCDKVIGNSFWRLCTRATESMKQRQCFSYVSCDFIFNQ